MLTERQNEVGSLVCSGLDPLPGKLPECITKRELKGKGDRFFKDITFWLAKMVDATAPYVCMYKPQSAYFEAMAEGRGVLQMAEGRRILQWIVHYIHTRYPGIPVFEDCKRGDIDRTQARYRIAILEMDGVDGMNFSPYMGKACMRDLTLKPPLPTSGEAIVGLGRTSNPEAWEVQDVVLRDGRRYWEYVAERTLAWAEELGIVENAGLVMGAAHKAVLLNNCPHHMTHYGEADIYSDHLRRAREIVGNKLWFLIPGIGTQGGFVKDTVEAADVGNGSIAINSSSGIIFASDGEDFAEAAGQKAKELRDQINQYRKAA